MPKEIFKYTNGEVTVIWQPKLCIHSGICWRGLGEVFNPKVRPWINPHGAPTDKIIEQVKQCPGGALSYTLNEAEDSSPEEKREAPAPDQPEPVKIEVQANGPLLVKQSCMIKLPDGREETRENSVALCRCGQSANKPYCDGTHRKVSFTG